MTHTKTSGLSSTTKWTGAILAAAALFATPAVLGSLTGSGNVSDIVQLTTSTASLSALGSTASGGSASGAPSISGSAFTLTNSGSNLDTFVRYGWDTTPYYGPSSASTSIVLRGTTHYISDLLWFKQETLTAAAVPTTSLYFSPLVIKNAASVKTATFTTAGNACTGWTNLPVSGFSAASAGTLTFQYHLASGPVNDAPVTSDTFQFCADTTNEKVVLAKTTDAATGSTLRIHTANSAGGILETYQYEFLSGSQTAGNKYCLDGFTGSGTSATPNLVLCQKLAYETAGSTTGKMFVLWDPPAYFPAQNQGGLVTYGLAGTQWNPFASTTTNSA